MMEALFPNDVEMANGPTLPFEAYVASLSAPKPETTSTFVSIQTSEYSQPIVPQNSRPRQLSQEEWEPLKPVLHLLYIQEDKTLEGVRRILRDKHRLFLTEKQLTRRFAKWGFKKNVKGTEREGVLQELDLAQVRVQRTAAGVKVTPAKRERWEKGLRKEIVQKTIPETSTSSATSMALARIPKASSINGFSARLCSWESPGITKNPTSKPLSGSKSANLMDLEMLNITHVGNGARQPSHWNETFGPNTSLEYSDPVIISRLFQALSLTPPSPKGISAFCQSPSTSVAEQTRYEDHISNDDLFELSHRSGRSFGLGAHITASSISSYPVENGTSNQCPTMRVFWSQYTKQFASPLSGELYPFPYLDATTDSVPKGSICTRRSEELEWREKLSKLENIFPETNISVLKTVENLADVCSIFGKDREAEDLLKRLIIIKEREYGSNSSSTLWSKLSLIKSIIRQRRYGEAKKLIDAVQEAILRVDNSCSSLVQRSLLIKATICAHLQNVEEAESILREVVQIRLIALGPRHGHTLAAIHSLSLPILYTKRYPESEELLRIALELGRTASEFSHSRKCQTIRALGLVLSSQGVHEESEALYRRSVEFSEKFFGKDHPETLKCNYELAQELRKKGLLLESESLLERTARIHSELNEEHQQHAIDTMRALGDLLLETRQYQKAEPWVEKTFRGCEKLYGPDHEQTLEACDKLGMFYERQRRYQDALDLYELIRGEINDVAGPGHPWNARLARWMDWNRRQLGNVGSL